MSEAVTGTSTVSGQPDPHLIKGSFLYRLVSRLLRLLVSVFFRQVEVVGRENIPDPNCGGLIFAGNHPNSLIDPALIIATSGRVVHFAAASILFKSRFLAFFLRALGAVPVTRRSDSAGTSVDNSDAFDALYSVLARGGAMGIFPEGISHSESGLVRLRTGAARIALGVSAKHSQTSTYIVPCGLVYVRRRRFRSRVLVQYGTPICVDEALCQQLSNSEAGAARALTEMVERGIRQLTINAPDWDTVRVLDGVRRLYQPPHISLEDRAELMRRFLIVYQEVQNEPDVARLYVAIKSYLDRLEDVGLTDRDLRMGHTVLRSLTAFFRNLLWLVVWLPLALPGAVLYAPLGALLSWGGQRFTPRKDVMATTRLIAGATLLILIYLSLLILAAWQFGWLGLAGGAVLLIGSGFATLKVLDRSSSLRRLGWSVVRTLCFRVQVRQLRRERDQLEALVVEATERYRPEEMEPLFPR